jgi:site-specific DNA-methyltransferase (cytosine-N4-specific)
VNIDRVRVKDAVNTLWWLSKTEHPKANNRNVLRAYSKAMQQMIKTKKYNVGGRPSERYVGEDWAKDSGGAIPSNVIEAAVEDTLLAHANTNSRDRYQEFCRSNNLRIHPARFPHAVVEFFIKFLTDEGDVVVDPFAGSNTVGAAAEELGREWIGAELDFDFVAGSIGRFDEDVAQVMHLDLADLALQHPVQAPDTPDTLL